MAIGLGQMVQTPIQDLSMDHIAAEAGISRGLLFHYFPTKTDFYLACIAAAGRRMLRNTAPEETAPGPEQVAHMIRSLIDQIDRRRDFYVALVHGHGVADARVTDVVDSVRTGNTDRVVRALGLSEEQRPVVRAWWAYVEDRALSWTAVPAGERGTDPTDLARECGAALTALLRVSA